MTGEDCPAEDSRDTGEEIREATERPKAEDARPFGGMTPREAVQKRWASAHAAEQKDGKPDESDAGIIAALRRKASKGDVNAARELREWRAVEGHLLEGEGWLEVLTERERALVRRLIQRALRRLDRST